MKNYRMGLLGCEALLAVACASTAAPGSGADAGGDGQSSVAGGPTAKVVGGKLEVTMDPALNSAAKAACAKQLAAGCTIPSADSCPLDEITTHGTTAKCEKEALAAMAAETSATWTCTTDSLAEATDFAPINQANTTLSACMKGAGETDLSKLGQNGEVTQDGTGYSVEAKSVVGHDVMLACDGGMCTCTIDGSKGSPFKDSDASGVKSPADAWIYGIALSA